MNPAVVLKAALAGRKKKSAPSAGMSAKTKSKDVKQAKAGKDFGKKNVPGKTGFAAVEANAKKEGMSDEAAKKTAGAVFWKQQKRG